MIEIVKNDYKSYLTHVKTTLSIPRRQVETGKCGQGRLLIVLGTSLYFLSLPIAGGEGGVGLGRDCQKRLLIMTGTSLYFITYSLQTS